MQTVSIRQVKDPSSALLQAVEAGDEVVITCHGRKIARLVRETDSHPSDAERERICQEVIARLRTFQARLSPDPDYRAGDWKPYRDQGR